MIKNFLRRLRDCDVFLNVSAGRWLRDEYMALQRKVLIDSDPAGIISKFSQVGCEPELAGQPRFSRA